MLIDTGNVIKKPSVNQIVFNHPWHEDDKHKKPYPVLIVSGEYEVNGRLSNFWYWQRVSQTGKITAKIECGYPHFTIAEGYKVRVFREVIIK